MRNGITLNDAMRTILNEQPAHSASADFIVAQIKVRDLWRRPKDNKHPQPWQIKLRVSTRSGCGLFDLDEDIVRLRGNMPATPKDKRGHTSTLHFENAIRDARDQFPNNGQFTLLANESINCVVSREMVPKSRGVYLIFRNDDLQNPLYIGKAGMMNQDGTWKRQSLAKRLTMKQGRVYRRDFFRKLINDEGLSGLTFRWFVTHDQKSKILPAFAEMKLLQAYVNQYDCLPKLNRCI